MFSITSKLNNLGILAIAALLVAGAPASAFAQAATLPYQPRTQLELISYLQGVLTTLQAQLLAINNVASDRVDSQSAILSQQIAVELRATFDAKDSSYVNAWFEYGVSNVIDTKTSVVRIRNTNRNDMIEHVRLIKNLQPNTAYVYRPVFELSNGTKYYGSIQNFGTAGNYEGVTGTTGIGGSVANIDSRGNSLSTGKTVYNLGEAIVVSWTTPKKDYYRGNTIFMFKVGDSYASSMQGRYADKESGDAYFSMYEKGTYEFRLYLDYKTTAVAQSRRITVN